MSVPGGAAEPPGSGAAEEALPGTRAGGGRYTEALSACEAGRGGSASPGSAPPWLSAPCFSPTAREAPGQPGFVLFINALLRKAWKKEASVCGSPGHTSTLARTQYRWYSVGAQHGRSQKVVSTLSELPEIRTRCQFLVFLANWALPDLPW